MQMSSTKSFMNLPVDFWAKSPKPSAHTPEFAEGALAAIHLAR